MSPLIFSSILLLSSTLGTGLVSGACLPSYTEIGGGCFLVIKDANTDFLSARKLCQSFNGDLAIVDDCALLGHLTAYLASPDVDISSAWIGGTDVASEGTWRWTDGREVAMGAPFWGGHISNVTDPSGGIAENCAAMSVADGYYFQDFNCDLSSGYAPLCQIQRLDDLNSTCPTPYVSLGGSCLEFLPTLDVSWDDARTVCQINGGDLAIIDDCHLIADVINYAQENALVPVYGFWIGGSDAASEGAWTWIDGSSMAMGEPFWGRADAGILSPDNGSGIQDCLRLGYDRHYFDDYTCNSTIPVPLCQSNVVYN